MRNVTVTLDENLAQRVRVRAAEEGKSVSRYLADLLERQMAEDDDYESSMQHFLALQPMNLSGGEPYPKRDELYERPSLR